MKEYPILFSGPMVRAILDGSKTMTRRVIKVRGHEGQPLMAGITKYWKPARTDRPGYIDCPYGEIGDRLWVRETWRPLWDGIDAPGTIGDCIQYKADMAKLKPHVPDEDTGFRFDDMCEVDVPQPKWRPSIHMFRWASRITLEVTGVRVERVQDISLDACWAEGVGIGLNGIGARYAFGSLWNHINEKRGFGWDVNPLVWVVQFRRVK